MKAPEHKPGTPPMHRIPIYDHRGNMRGHVGKTATAATVARFLGRHGAQLTKHDGRDAWVGHVPPPPPPSDFVMGPKGPKVNPKAFGKATDKPPFPPEPKIAAKPKPKAKK